MLSSSLPEPESHDSFEHSAENASPPWSMLDLALFGTFFALTVLFLPLLFLFLLQLFRPNVHLTELSGVEQVILQGVMDLMLVGFIAFLVKVRGESFLQTIHWFRNYQARAGLLIALGIAFLVKAPGESFLQSIQRFRNYQARASLLIALGAGLAMSVLVASSFFPPSAQTPIEKLISSSHALYMFALFGIGVAPLLEEIIFRGFLFKVLSDVAGAPVAVPVTAGLFALLHVPQLWGSWAGILLIFVVGYVLSAVRHRTNSLIPSLIIHMTYNAMLFAVFAISALAGGAN